MKHPSEGSVQPITRVAEYDGEAVVKISATQLGREFTPQQAKKIVDEWCLFFTDGHAGGRRGSGRERRSLGH